jgi:hypothetical protein
VYGVSLVFNLFLLSLLGLTILANKEIPAGHLWLTPVILATQEAEIRRIEVQSQPRPYLKKNLSPKKGWWSGSRCRL